MNGDRTRKAEAEATGDVGVEAEAGEGLGATVGAIGPERLVAGEWEGDVGGLEMEADWNRIDGFCGGRDGGLTGAPVDVEGECKRTASSFSFSFSFSLVASFSFQSGYEYQR